MVYVPVTPRGLQGGGHSGVVVRGECMMPVLPVKKPAHLKPESTRASCAGIVQA